MSLRDYFAAQALAGLCAAYSEVEEHRIATRAYAYADAMLKAADVEPVKGSDPRD